MSKQAGGATVSSELARFVSGLSHDEVPDEARELARRAFVDTVGVTLAGAGEGAGQRALSSVRRWGSGETSLIGRAGTAPLMSAILANATAGHGIDFDDVTWGMDGHPSVPMVAPLLAVGEQESSSGAELITAYVAGFEAQCYLAAAISPDHYEKGWHATATFGTFGSAAACARLLGLSTDRTCATLNIAASMPAGLKRNFGTMTKPLHAGQAARSGATAAALAAEGLTADDAAIAGDRGFFDLYRGGAEPALEDLPSLGDRWAILEDGIHVKKYPCCYYTHTAIAATTDLVTDHDLSPDEIQEVTVHTSRGALETLQYENPSTSLEAKFSMPYCIAYGIVNRTVDLEAFDEGQIDTRDVKKISEIVTTKVNPEIAYDANAATVELTTTEGETLGSSREVPPGSHSRPLTRSELRDKFHMCARRVLSDSQSSAAYEAVGSIDQRPDIGSVLTALSPDHPG